MRATHAAIDEVWFDPEDEVLVEEPLEPKKMVVRYEDYRGGAAARWGAGDWGGCEEEEDDW
jgi:solute carrier family 25 thiamine pyrophosphate transporter 19